MHLLNVLAAGLGMSLLAPFALADYDGLEVEHTDTVTISSVSYDVYRVYARFDDPDDQLFVWFGRESSHPEGGAGVENYSGVDDETLGSGFFNLPGQTAPTSTSGSAPYDTFMTIGVSLASQGPGGVDATAVMPTTPTFISGNTWATTTYGGGVYVLPNSPQAYAGYEDDGDEKLRVMVMQLTVRSGEKVMGLIHLRGRYADGTLYTHHGETFSSE